MESESLFIIDDSPDGRLENARQRDAFNVFVFLNKFEGAQMQHVWWIAMTEDAKNQIRIAEFGESTPGQVAQFESDRIAERKRGSQIRKRENDSDE